MTETEGQARKLYFIDFDASSPKPSPTEIMKFLLGGAIPIERTFEYAYKKGFVHLAFENPLNNGHLILNIPSLRLKP